MKTKLLFLLLFISSIGILRSQKKMTPQDVKLMTTKQFETNKDLVFKSIISLLQSESYLIGSASTETGLINATKTEGKRSKSSTSQISFYVEEFNSDLTEIKLTIYESLEKTSYGMWGEAYKNNKINMVTKPDIYNTWFNNLRAEIERRRALTQ